mgnify:CR=1 FL=1
MKVAKIKNESYYDKTFFGISVTIEPGEDEIDLEEFSILNKNCPNFQDFTNPPVDGGKPRIRVLGSTPDNNVRVNAKGLGKTTMFTAPEVKLSANDITEVPKDTFNKLQDDERFNRLLDSGELKMMGWGEK